YNYLIYGTLLGSQLFDSFIVGPVAFKKLTKENFSTLQSNLFPYYFGIQAVAPIGIALTTPFKLSSAVASYVSLALVSVLGLSNQFLIYPVTNKLVAERQFLSESLNSDPNSKELLAKYEKADKTFKRIHGLSMFMNLVSIIATIVYGL
ncbi:hypothetical protein CANCADRAFT_16528, partial [Tortispora caseinolytica NRRL Y-17796]